MSIHHQTHWQFEVDPSERIPMLMSFFGVTGFEVFVEAYRRVYQVSEWKKAHFARMEADIDDFIRFGVLPGYVNDVFDALMGISHVEPSR